MAGDLILFDSVDLAAIPSTAKIIGGYVDGEWPTATSADFAARVAAGATPVTITVKGWNDAGELVEADVADSETGDLTPESAARWAKETLAAGRRPTIYCNRSSWQSVLTEVAAAGVVAALVDYWIADWTGVPHTLPDSSAVQYADPATSGGNYDLSICSWGWAPLAKTPPPPPPPAETPERVTLPLLSPGDLGGPVKSLQRLLHSSSPGLPVSGYFDATTADAVIDRKRFFGWRIVNAEVGPELWQNLIDFGG